MAAESLALSGDMYSDQTVIQGEQVSLELRPGDKAKLA